MNDDLISRQAAIEQARLSKTDHDKAVAHGRFMAICEVQDMIREVIEDGD